MVKNKLNKKVSKKDKIKGIIFILIGIIGFIIYTAVSFKDLKLGGGFFILLIAIGFIWEGMRIRKGKGSILFPSYSN